MSDINLIKTVLFNASTTQEAITRLSELGFTVRECTFTHNGYHIQADQINFVDVTFWQTKSLRCPLAVCINGNLFDYDDRRSFLAGQCETVEPVPAASPEITGQRPACENPQDCINCPNKHVCLLQSETFREPADRFDYDQAEREWECHSNSLSTARRVPEPKIPFIEVLRLREILRNERRLKNSHVKGLSS